MTSYYLSFSKEIPHQTIFGIDEVLKEIFVEVTIRNFKEIDFKHSLFIEIFTESENKGEVISKIEQAIEPFNLSQYGIANLIGGKDRVNPETKKVDFEVNINFGF